MPSRREELLRKWKLRGWTGMQPGETGELIELQAEDIKALLADIGRVSKIRQELERTVDKLPKCWQFNDDKTALVQTCPITLGMKLFVIYEGVVHPVKSYWIYDEGSFGAEVLAKDSRWEEPIGVNGWEPEECYNSLEAAEFAKQAEKGTG